MSEVDPYRAYNFKLRIGESEVGHFTECSGLGAKVQAIQYRESGDSQVVRQIPGHVQYADVTLRYGLTDSQELWEWFMNTVRGRVERKNVSIAILASDGVAEVMRWNLFNAWISEWRGAPLDALSHEVAIESVTIVFETMDRVVGRAGRA